MEYEWGDVVFDTAHLKREFIAGGIAGGIGVFIGFPMDLIKVNLQVYPDKYKSAWGCFRYTVKQHGFSSLYRGVVPPIFTQGFINSMLFMGESTTMRILQPGLKRGEVGTPFNTIVAGAFGGIVQSCLLVPTDVVKCTMQATESSTSASQNVFKETMSCCKQIYGVEGVRGFYKGYFATLTREVPSIGMYFFTYKNLRDQITKYEGNNHDSHSNFATLIAGGLAGATSWGVVYPSDVIKTYMQISTVPVDTDKLAYKDMRIRDVATSLYRRHGARIFFNGLGITVLRAFPVNAAVFYFYELISDYMHLK